MPEPAVEESGQDSDPLKKIGSMMNLSFSVSCVDVAEIARVSCNSGG